MLYQGGKAVVCSAFFAWPCCKLGNHDLVCLITGFMSAALVDAVIWVGKAIHHKVTAMLCCYHNQGRLFVQQTLQQWLVLEASVVTW